MSDTTTTTDIKRYVLIYKWCDHYYGEIRPKPSCGDAYSPSIADAKSLDDVLAEVRRHPLFGGLPIKVQP